MGQLNKVDDTFCKFLSVVYESEDEHRYHMYQKKKNAQELGKSVKDLKNKKYSDKKSEEEKRKADLRYAYKEGQYMQNARGKNTNIGEVNALRLGNLAHDYNDKQIRIYMNKETEEDCKKLLRKLRYFSDSAGDGNDPNADKKYEIAFRIFSKRFGIKGDSSVNMGFADKEDYSQSENIKKHAIEAGISLGATIGSVALKKKIQKNVHDLTEDLSEYKKILSKGNLTPEKKKSLIKERDKKIKQMRASMKLAKLMNIPVAASAAATLRSGSKLTGDLLNRRDDEGNSVKDKIANKIRDKRDGKYKEKYKVAMPKDKKDKLATGKKGDTMLMLSEWGGGHKLKKKRKADVDDGDKKPGMSLYHVSPVTGIDTLRASAHSENYSGYGKNKETAQKVEALKDELKDYRKKYADAKKSGDKKEMQRCQKNLNEINDKLTKIESYSGQYHSKRRVYVTAGKSAEDAFTHTAHGVGRNVYRVKGMPDNVYIDPEANRSSKIDAAFSSRKKKLGDMSGVPMYIEVDKGKEGIPVEQVDTRLHGNVIPTLSGHEPKYLFVSKKANNDKKKK